MPYRLLIRGLIIIPCVYILIGICSTILIRVLNPLKNGKRKSENIYVTFDDGIDSEYTPLILDLLREHKVRATFFIMSSTVDGNREIIKRMKNEGHSIGQHSFNHKNQILQSPKKIKEDFSKSKEIFLRNGVNTDLYRPPWGHMNPYGLYICRKDKKKIILWNVIVQDWEKDTSEDILCRKLEKKVREGAVICLHDGRGKNKAPLKTLKALERMIPKWKEEGYRFETIDGNHEKCTA